jgi:threonine synthase
VVVDVKPTLASESSRQGAWPGVIAAYRRFLPVSDKTPVVTLNEGNTPLIPAPRLAKAVFGPDPRPALYLKFEGLNPTASFKDRGMTMAVSKAVEAGAKGVICASTGNTSASAAAYAARAGLACLVVIPKGAVASGKLAQALIYGARVLAVEGNFDVALELVRGLCARHPEIAVVNSINPYRLEGQKTGAFEIVEQLGRAPEFLAIPVGNAGNITAYWRGFKEAAATVGTGRPRMLGFQAEGAAPFLSGRFVDRPKTIATAIRIGHPASWDGARSAVAESDGQFTAVSDEEIVVAYRLLARLEGVFCEPASAVTLAGLAKLAREGGFSEAHVGTGAAVVCILTGNGLKDPNRARRVSIAPEPVRADLDLVEEVAFGMDGGEVGR